MATLSELFPAAEVMDELNGFVGPFVAYGVGLCLVVWLIGYVVWMIVEFVR